MLTKLSIKEVRKFITALIGAALTALSLGLIPDAAGSWIAVVVTFATAYGVYKVPNAPVENDAPR